MWRAWLFVAVFATKFQRTSLGEQTLQHQQINKGCRFLLMPYLMSGYHWRRSHLAISIRCGAICFLLRTPVGCSIKNKTQPRMKAGFGRRKQVAVLCCCINQFPTIAGCGVCWKKVVLMKDSSMPKNKWSVDGQRFECPDGVGRWVVEGYPFSLSNPK